MRLKILTSTLIVALGILMPSAGFASVLLQDDFNDNSLDPAKWRVVLPSIEGTPGVFEQNQHIELVDRGHLVTANQFDPLIVGPLTITGTWTFNTSQIGFQQEDRMSVFTRTDGVPGGPPYGATLQGVSFNLQMDGPGNPGFMFIGDNGLNFAKVPIQIHNGDTFYFTIRDDGTNVMFSVQPVGGAVTTISAIDPSHFASNYIDFENSFRNGNLVPIVSYLDDVVITGTAAVPEPSTLALTATGLLCIVGCGVWRRSCRSGLHIFDRPPTGSKTSLE
jgi:hypothetical protein